MVILEAGVTVKKIRLKSFKGFWFKGIVLNNYCQSGVGHILAIGVNVTAFGWEILLKSICCT